MSTIIMRRGPEPGKIFPIEGDMIKIGRGRKNNIIIHDNEVSREHCYLTRANEYYLLRDGGSSNGTFVNGQRVDDEGWLLKSDCIIEIGDSITLEYVSDSSQIIDTVLPPSTHTFIIVFVDSAGTQPQIYPLDGDSFTVGRDLTCTIVIQEPEVSRQHLRLHYSDLGYLAEDLGSTNGTQVNGEKLETSRLLRINDIVQIGSMVKLLYTDNPTKFIGEAQTTLLDVLGDDDDTVSKNVIDNSEMLDKIKRRKETSPLSEIKPGALAGHIFIAYAGDDWEQVIPPMSDYLRQRKISIWADEALNYDSTERETVLNHVLSECAVLVVVLSQSGLDADYIKRAWRYFHSREKPIILVAYEQETTLPMELQNLKVVKFNRAAPAEGYAALAAEIMRLKV